MISRVGSFFRAENGAIKADWMVLTAGTVALALGVSSLAFGGTDLSTETHAITVSAAPVGN